jgi:6-pyruvoyl-tetrahydropterin synthase
MGNELTVSENAQYWYQVYGLTVNSEFELPELPLVDSQDSADVSIFNGDFQQEIDQHSPTNECLYRVIYDSVGKFLIKNGNKIICDLDSAEISTQKLFRRFVEHQLFAIVLLQRGVLLLHGSAVAVNGKGAIFLGPQGAGKSTTISAFHQQGYQVLADDIVAVQFSEGKPTVVPGVTQPRVNSDTVAALDFEETAVYPDDYGPKKHYIESDAEVRQVPLETCYILREGENIEIMASRGMDTFFHITRHVHPLGFLTDTDMTPMDFEQCSMLADKSQIRILKRPKEYDQLLSIVDAVVADMGIRS